MLQLWEVLWAYSWQQRRCSDKAAAGATNGHHTPAAASPSKGSAPAAASTDTGQGDSNRDGSAAELTGSPVQLLADGRAVSPDGKGDAVKGGSSSTSDSRSSLQQQPHLELFICFVAAVIQSQRRTLLDHCYNADDVLRLFHGVRRIDLWQCLDKAYSLLGALHSAAI